MLSKFYQNFFKNVKVTQTLQAPPRLCVRVSLPATRPVLSASSCAHHRTFEWCVNRVRTGPRVSANKHPIQKPLWKTGLLPSAATLTGSVQFSSVASDSLRSHGLQHARPPCPPRTPGVYSNLCPLSQWCHPHISSSVVPFSSCPQSFPASGSFPRCQFFVSGDQNIGVSASASSLPMNIQDRFLLGWTGLMSLQSKGLSRVFSNTTVQKHQFFSTQLSL